MQPQNIKLIIGLGNPGKECENTYHNVGFLFIDFLEKNQDSSFKFQVLRSNVFMNHSGEFVKKEMKNRNLKPENLLIAHDDSDIELGKVKLSFGRGSAGHKGVQNIIDQLKTKDFWRLRIGVRPRSSRAKAGDFVLKKISPMYRNKITSAFKSASFQD